MGTNVTWICGRFFLPTLFSVYFVALDGEFFCNHGMKAAFNTVDMM